MFPGRTFTRVSIASSGGLSGPIHARNGPSADASTLMRFFQTMYLRTWPPPKPESGTAKARTIHPHRQSSSRQFGSSVEHGDVVGVTDGDTDRDGGGVGERGVVLAVVNGSGVGVAD